MRVYTIKECFQMTNYVSFTLFVKRAKELLREKMMENELDFFLGALSWLMWGESKELIVDDLSFSSYYMGAFEEEEK